MTDPQNETWPMKGVIRRLSLDAAGCRSAR